MAGSPSTVFVRNLAWDTKDEGLRAHFASAGKVVSASVAASSSGRSKGHGLVAFSTAAEADNCITTLHQSTLDGRVIDIRLDRGATEKTARAADAAPRTRGARGTVAERSASNPLRVFVRNLDWGTNADQLRAHFASAGTVTDATVAESATGRSKGHGTVTFATAEEAARAVSTLSGTTLSERQIEVREDRGDIIKGAAPEAGGDGAGGARRRRRRPAGGAAAGGATGAAPAAAAGGAARRGRRPRGKKAEGAAAE